VLQSTTADFPKQLTKTLDEKAGATWAALQGLLDFITKNSQKQLVWGQWCHTSLQAIAGPRGVPSSLTVYPHPFRMVRWPHFIGTTTKEVEEMDQCFAKFFLIDSPYTLFTSLWSGDANHAIKEPGSKVVQQALARTPPVSTF
jgi:hypothetical protein